MIAFATSERNRLRWLTLCAAAWGFGIGISLLGVWDRPAPPGQLPSLMTSLGKDAHAPFRFMTGLVVMTIVVAFAMRPILLRFAASGTRAWARNSAAVAMLAALWVAVINNDLPWAILPPALTIAALLPLRSRDLHFTQRDAILIPVWAALYLAMIDIGPLAVDEAAILAAAMVFAVRIAVTFIRPDRALSAPLCFAAPPLALVTQTILFARDQRYSPWPALVIAVVTPFLFRALIRDTARARSAVGALIAFVIYPLASFGYMNATSMVAAEGKPRVEFFEDAQHVVAAGEMLRGEKPYRDIVPPHGFIQDGLLDYLILQTEPLTVGHVLKVRGLLAGGNAIANYALAAAATGSPHAGIAALFLAAMFGSAGGTFRVLPALFALACLCAAVRRRDLRLLAAGAVLTVLAILTSLDFGAYTLVALIFALALFGRNRSEKFAALRWGAIAFGAASAITALAMLIGGFLIDFVRVTLFEIATLGPVYTLPPFSPPPGFQTFRFVPEALIAIFHKSTYLYVIWIVNFLALVAALAIGVRAMPRRRAHLHALMVLSSFVAICFISYAERHHQHFQFAVAPLVVAAVWRMGRARDAFARLAAPVVALLVIMIASPTVHLAITAFLRRSRAPIDAGWTTSNEPRVGSAWIRERDAAILAASRAYLERTVGPDGTFFDFTNRAMLFFLLDRDCPIRQIEPAFYETEERQREVIARIQNDPRIRAALVPKPSSDDHTGVDIPNPMRAPLVWKYLQENFQPDFEDENIVFWRRK